MTTRHKLQSQNIRPTPARIAVISCLEKAKHPLSVSQICDSLTRANYQFDQATIYRALEILANNSLVKQVDFQEGMLRYELEGDHHHHLVCKTCGNITPIYDQCLSLDEKTISNKYKFQISNHNLEFFGTCLACQNS